METELRAIGRVSLAAALIMLITIPLAAALALIFVLASTAPNDNHPRIPPPWPHYRGGR